jgi:aminoglycoside phosphotransferase (APT) family kinase protein
LTIVDAFLRARRAELEAAGLPREEDWFTLLATPWWHASRHVVALVHARRNGEMKLVIKLPRRPGDDHGIENEARSLRYLEALKGVSARAPRVLALTRFRSQALLAETAVNGPLLAPDVVRADPERATRLATAFVRGLPLTVDHEEGAAAFARLLEQPMARALESVGHSSPLCALVERTLPVLEPLRSVALPLVFEHGDLAHPNLVVRSDGALAAIDWERSEERGLPLHDLSFVLQYLGEARTAVFDPLGRCQVFDATFLPPTGWARPVLLKELDRLGLSHELLAPLVLSTWARSSISLLSRLWASPDQNAAWGDDAEAVEGSFAEDRDFALWQHVVAQVEALSAR